MSLSEFLTILPPVIVAAWAILLLLADLFLPDSRKGVTALLAALGLASRLGVTLAMAAAPGKPGPAFYGMVILDGFAIFANTIILASGLLGMAWPMITCAGWISIAGNITFCCSFPLPV